MSSIPDEWQKKQADDKLYSLIHSYTECASTEAFEYAFLLISYKD